jgi:hypothetical protein
MNRDDIIKLAREAGIVVTGEAVWKLCELVAAHEREACAKVCDQKPVAWRYKWPWNERWHLIEEAPEKLAGIAFVEPLYATPQQKEKKA